MIKVDDEDAALVVDYVSGVSTPMENANAMEAGITSPDGFLEPPCLLRHALPKPGKGFRNMRIDIIGRIKAVKALKLRQRHIATKPL